jgi:hypothetical protein
VKYSYKQEHVLFSFKALMYNVLLIFSLFLLSPESTFTMWKKTGGNQSVLVTGVVG